MDRREGYIGKLSVTWETGEKNIFEIAQSKDRIWIGDHLVNPHNEKSLQGILNEINEVFGKYEKIKSYNWVELVGRLKFPIY
jgi:hypothetical protein